MEKIKRLRVVDIVIERILNALAKGEFKPGDRLPSETELTRILGVSRNALREALKQLESLGILDIRQGDGTYVTNGKAGGALGSTISVLFLLDQSSIAELLEARELVEVKIAGLAATRADEKDLDAISDALRELKKVLHDPERYAEKDFEFHLALTKAAKNFVLEKFFTSISELLREQLVRVARVPGVIRKSYEYHEKIARAVKARNAAEAQDEMREHISNVVGRLITELSRRIGAKADSRARPGRSGCRPRQKSGGE